MWAALPRRLPAPACRRLATAPRAAPPAAASESPLGLLHAIQGAGADAEVAQAAPAGHVLSASSGLARVAMQGPVAVGASVDLGDGSQGMVLQFDRKGAIVAPLTRGRPREGALAVMGGPLAVQAPTIGCMNIVSVPEILSAADGPISRRVLQLPSMPPPTRRRPVTRRLPSGLATAEALLPFGEGQRIGFVGPAGTGKSTAARMLLASHSEDTACVLATQQPLQKLEQQLQGHKSSSLTVVHADPMQDTLAAQYMVPICAVHIASQLRSSHRHVVLVLDDLIRFAAVAAELESGAPSVRGLLPLSVPHVLGAALDASGVVLGNDGQESALSVVALLDLDPNDELPPHVRGLWRGAEPSLDVSLRFSAQVAIDGTLPAIDPKELLPGFAPPFQAPLLRMIRSELIAAFRAGYDLGYRLKLTKELGMHIDIDEHEDLASASAARLLLAHSAPRHLPELAVLLCASLIFRLPPRRLSPTAVADFQAALIETVREVHPALWSDLERLEALSEADSLTTLRHLGEALHSHRFDFHFTRPEL